MLVGWHIDQGASGGVALDGLNVAFFAYVPGHMLQTKWRVALYPKPPTATDIHCALR